jgi:hypothetical protein
VNKETHKKLYAAFLNFKGIGFVSFQHKSKSGEVSKILLNVGASYEKARLEDIVTLDLGIKFLRSPLYTREDWNTAIKELYDDLRRENTYLSDKKLSPCLHLPRTLKFSHRTQDLYLLGKVERVEILRRRPSRVLRNPVSIAKHIIQSSYLKTSHFKLFLLKDMLGTVKVNKEVIEVI